MMTVANPLRWTAIVASLVGAAAAPAGAMELLWSNYSSSYGDTVRSVAYPGVDEEAADDFQVSGTIERLIVYAQNDCTFGCTDAPQPSGAVVRFHAATPAGPGSLLHEERFLPGEPGFLYQTTGGVRSIDLTLRQPFAAEGWQFLAVQLEFDEPFNWWRSPSNDNAPRGSHAMWRDNAAGGAWQQAHDYWGAPVHQDLAFELYGCPAGGCPPAPLVAGCGAWSEVPSPNPPGDARLEDVDALAPWDAWAVGSFSGPIDGYWQDVQQSLAMHWNGNSWSIVPTPNPAPNPSTTQVSLEAVSAVATDDVWAVGRKRAQDAGGYTGGRVLAMHWDGFEWQDMNAPWPQDQDGSPYTGASGEQFYDVVTLAADDVWMVGRYWQEQPSGVINWPGVAMHWNGGGFTIHPLPMVSPQGDQLALAVAAVSSDDVWAVGEGRGTNEPAYIWHWDGSSWSHVSAPTPGADRTLSSIVVVAADDVWAGGSYRDSQYNYFPLLLHWDGASWTHVSSPAGGEELVALASDNVLTAGVNGWARWDGSAWSADTGPQIIPWGTINGLDTLGPCELWGVGWRSGVTGETTLTVKLQPVGGGSDGDGDGVADDLDNCPFHHNPEQLDCDGDGAGDVCELISGSAADCNGNGQPDSCESFTDCDGNAVPDECQPDCNANDVADACDITSGDSADCEPDGIPDECQSFDDCNDNGISDQCDLGGGSSADSNANGHPDECEALGPEFATVTTQDDVVDFGGAQRIEDLPGLDGLVSFREALAAVNNTPGPQTVAFNIPRERWEPWYGGVLLRLDEGIFVVSDDETTIDFTTQARFTGPDDGEVSIYGYEVNAWGVTAMLVTADHCVVKGMGRVLQRGYGVTIRGNHNRVIGSTLTGPWYAAVYITGGWEGPVASGNVIGGTEPGEGNLLSGGDGVRIDGPAANNVVVGNQIVGLSIRAGATGNRIGGPTPAERNVISGAGYYGEEGCPTGDQVEIWNADDNLIEGNYIGTTPDGLASAGQIGPTGIDILDSDRTIIRDNVISGILVEGFDHCAGDRSGTAVAIQGNSSNTIVQRNRIGTDALGLAPIPNYLGGTTAFWPGSGVPGPTLFEDNVVAYNETHGLVAGYSTSGVTMRRNAVFDNGALGISLANGGGNGGQPAPLLTQVTSDDVTVHVSGTLSGAAGRAFVVEIFASAVCDPSGAGEGERFLGSVAVTTDAGGNASFETDLPAVGLPGSIFTATATDLTTGNTSEFSSCRTVQAQACAAPPPEVEGLVIEADHATVGWLPFGPSVRYDVARGTLEGMRLGVPADCLVTGEPGSSFQDMTMPDPAVTLYYLVRATSDCGAGPWSAGTTVRATCP